MPFGEAIKTYSLLTIGDGLVSQIPALLLSVATGLIVTRSVADQDMGSDIIKQLAANRMPLRVAGFAALGLCLIPGLPKIPFILAGGVMLLASTRAPAERTDEPETSRRPSSAPAVPDTPELLAAEIQVDPLGLELSADLIDLVDPTSGGDLLDRVKSLRRKIATDLGIVAPPVRTRDNLQLPSRTYAIMLFGIEVARGEAPPGTVLAIGDYLGSLPGEPTQEPVFGLEAKWIPAELRSQAELSGATVVDRASVITTHLAEVVTQHAARLLGREDVRMLTDVVKRTHPVVVEELTPAQLSLGEVQRVLQSLLDEGVSIRDLVRIFEALSLRATRTKELDPLVEAARIALGPAIVAPYLVDKALHVITLEPQLEQRILESLRPVRARPRRSRSTRRPARRCSRNLAQLAADVENRNIRPVLVCAPQIRAAVHRLVHPIVAAPRRALLPGAHRRRPDPLRGHRRCRAPARHPHEPALRAGGHRHHRGRVARAVGGPGRPAPCRPTWRSCGCCSASSASWAVCSAGRAVRPGGRGERGGRARGAEPEMQRPADVDS